MEEHNGIPSMPLPNAEPPEGLWPELIVNGWERVHNHAVSPDGKRVAFYCDRAGKSDLWVTRMDLPAFPERLTFNRPYVNWWEDEAPVWSPDGQWLVYGCYRDDVSNLYAVPAGGGAARALTELSYDASDPAFSPDGKTIAFSTHKGGAAQIASVPFEGGWVSGLTHGSQECGAPSWSHDGGTILYSASTPVGPRRTDVYAIRPDGSSRQRLTPDDGAEYWSATYAPDGHTIALLSNRSGFDELWLMSADGTNLRQCSSLRQDIESFNWAPDSRRIALIVSERGADWIIVLDTVSGKVHRVPTGAGNFSSPQWACDREAVIVSFDSPSCPPDLYLVEIGSGTMRPLTSGTAPALRNHQFVTPRFIEYASFDGWLIPAFLYAPPHPPKDARGYPGLVYPHGGPTSEYDLHWDPVLQYFVAKGYTIICPNFRGSTGYGRQFKEANLFDWGNGDLKDCLTAANIMGGQRGVDSRRLGIWGQSYGGYLTLLALAKDREYRFRCGVSLYGDSHLKTSWALGDHAGRQDVEWQMGTPAVHAALYEASSPLNFVEAIRAPLLVIHGERDPRVPLNESAQLVAALKRFDKTFEYKTYPQEGHGFTEPTNALDALRRIERFLDWHLL